jgi:hypothetical protein
MVILPDEDFDKLVRVDFKFIKQVWAAMEKGEKLSLLLLVKVKGRRTNNWLGAEDSHIILVLGCHISQIPMKWDGI